MREQRREQEQPADTVRRAVAREEPGVREQEQPADTVRRAVARQDPAVREQEQPVDTMRRAVARVKLLFKYFMCYFVVHTYYLSSM